MLTLEYWSIALEANLNSACLYSLLSLDEQRRSQRFKFQKLQENFVLGRGSLRQILGSYLNQDPASICFEYGAYGKPFVQGISFNFSHTKELAICVVAAEQKLISVGIDIEQKNRQTNTLSLAKRFFHPTEYQYLSQLEISEQADYFLQLWTAKEAYLKAKGTGLQGGLDQVIVNLEPQPNLQILEPQECQSWSLQIFQPNPDHWAAIAVDAPVCQVINRGEWQV